MKFKHLLVMTTTANAAAWRLAPSAAVWVFLGLLTLAAGGVAYYFLRRSKAESRAAQQHAKNKAASCATEIEAFSLAAITVLEAKVAAASKGCSPDDSRALMALLAAFKTGVASVTQRFDRLSETSNPDDDGKSSEEYASMERSYDMLLSGLRDAGDTQASLENRLDKIKRMADRAKPALDKLGKDIEAAAAAIADAQVAGFKTGDLAAALAEAMTDQEAATAALGEGRSAAAKSVCDSGSTKAKKVCTDVKALAARKNAVERHATTVRASFAATASSVDASKRDFAAIQMGFVASSWEPVEDNVSQAMTAMLSAAQKCDAAAVAAKMEAQDWDSAEKLLGDAEKLLSEAVLKLASITALRRKLEAAKADAPAKREAALAAIDEAERFIAENAADIGDVLKDSLQRKVIFTRKRFLTRGAALLESGKKPDYLTIIEASEDASNVAGEVLRVARHSLEGITRLRVQATTAIETAAANIATATQYVQEHAGMVGDQCDESIRSAEKLLKSARRYGDSPADQLNLATQAANIAESALSNAQDAVRMRQR